MASDCRMKSACPLADHVAAARDGFGTSGHSEWCDGNRLLPAPARARKFSVNVTCEAVRPGSVEASETRRMGPPTE
jgi:hypothetical protein